MPPKPMTPAERLVGRKLPKEPTYLDQILSSYVKEDGTTCGRAEPSDSWLRPAFAKARKLGLVRLMNKMTINGGRAFGIYQLTDKGKNEAREALDRVQRIRSARRQWAVDFQAARRDAVAAKNAQAVETECNGETPQP